VNQHTSNTKASRVRAALVELRLATANQVAWHAGVSEAAAQDVLRRLKGVRIAGVAEFHHGARGRFPRLYEPAQAQA
jgi:hypothetical protein